MQLLNFTLFKNAMKFSEAIYPYRGLLHSLAIKKGQSVLLFGDVEPLLVKSTFKYVGKTGTIYLIGRTQNITKYQKFNRGKYKPVCQVNPNFEQLPKDSIDVILLINISLDQLPVSMFSSDIKCKLKTNGLLAIIDEEGWEKYIQFIREFEWLERVENDYALVYMNTKKSNK